MVDIYISVGSNVEPQDNVLSGVLALQRGFGELRLSRVYESEAVGFVGANFLNLVVAAEVELSIPEVIAVLRKIEDEHRRDRATPRFSPRTLDLDLLLYGDCVYEGNGVHLPRDEITKNAFVLAPLAELAPALAHPIIKRDYQTLWEQYDKASQCLWPIEFDWENR
jgi:2-amino-4-hydroxy-6-hydroxymethyldihydropteridine diphosphokinase